MSNIFKLARLFQIKMALGSDDDLIEDSDLEPISPEGDLEDVDSDPVDTSSMSPQVAEAISAPLNDVDFEKLNIETKERLTQESVKIAAVISKFGADNDLINTMSAKKDFLVLRKTEYGVEIGERVALPERAMRAVSLLKEIKKNCETLKKNLLDSKHSIERTIKPSKELLKAIERLRSENSMEMVTGWQEPYREFANLAELFSLSYPIPLSYSDKTDTAAVRHGGHGLAPGRNSKEAIAEKRKFSKLTEWISTIQREVLKLVGIYIKIQRRNMVSNPQSFKDIDKVVGVTRRVKTVDKTIRKQETFEIEKALDIFKDFLDIDPNTFTARYFINVICKTVVDGNAVEDLLKVKRNPFSYRPSFLNIQTEDLLRHAFTEWRVSPQAHEGKPVPPGIPLPSYSVKEGKVITKYLNSPLIMEKLSELNNRIKYADFLYKQSVERDEDKKIQTFEKTTPSKIDIKTVDPQKYIREMSSEDRSEFFRLPEEYRREFMVSGDLDLLEQRLSENM